MIKHLIMFIFLLKSLSLYGAAYHVKQEEDDNPGTACCLPFACCHKQVAPVVTHVPVTTQGQIILSRTHNTNLSNSAKSISFLNILIVDANDDDSNKLYNICKDNGAASGKVRCFTSWHEVTEFFKETNNKPELIDVIFIANVDEKTIEKIREFSTIPLIISTSCSVPGIDSFPKPFISANLKPLLKGHFSISGI